MLIFFSRLLTTGFFIGYIPGAPGTYGSIFAIFLLYLFPDINNLYSMILIFLIGVLLSSWDEKIYKIKDDSRIIIDEIYGIFVAFLYLPLKIPVIITGFILFRLFDIFKPLIIDKSQNLPSGWGVMVDDLIAGVFTNIILQIIFIYV